MNGRKPIAGLALTCGLGIELLDADADGRIVWRWSNETRERRSKFVDGAFRAGQVWRRLSDFTPYERYKSVMAT